MLCDPDFKTKVFNKMKILETKGYIEKVSHDELQRSGQWYLPVHPVIHPHQPNKVRVTHDASAKTAGFALNDFLLKGPDTECKLVSNFKGPESMKYF